ncbi:MAG: hypothetical protein II917_02570 [Synergistaceae bacterium]|nr:hypothetical protein [Synergistaceae bacterium]
MRTFSAKDFPSVKMTPEEQAQEEAENEAFARAISYLPQIYERLSDVMNTIRAILPKIPKSVDTYDLQVEADLIDDILTRICGEEAQS